MIFRALLLVALVACVHYGAKRLGLIGAPEVRIVGAPGSGQEVHAEIDGGKLTYGVNGPAEETYMVFGGDTGGTSFAHGSFNGIELQTILRIRKRHPDFTRCDSAGAPEAKRVSEHVNVVANPALLARFQVAMKEAAGREKSGGERLCATVKGHWLTFEQMEKQGVVVTGEQYAAMLPGHATKQHFLHLESLETRDCKDAI